MKSKKVDKKLPPPSLHQQILSDIEENIVSGKWPPGYRIPFEHELMEEYSCSRMTVNKVLTHLASRKLIERRRRVGSFVTKPQSSSAVLEIGDIKSEVEELGATYSHAVLSRRKGTIGPADQKLLAAKKGSLVLKLVVGHYSDERPFCLEERLISLDAVPEAVNETFAELPPGAWLMRQVPWNFAEHRIRAVAAKGVVAEKLEIEEGSPCLVVERSTWSADHSVTFVRLTYPADQHELLARFKPSNS